MRNGCGSRTLAQDCKLRPKHILAQSSTVWTHRQLRHQGSCMEPGKFSGSSHEALCIRKPRRRIPTSSQGLQQPFPGSSHPALLCTHNSSLGFFALGQAFSCCLLIDMALLYFFLILIMKREVQIWKQPLLLCLSLLLTVIKKFLFFLSLQW